MCFLYTFDYQVYMTCLFVWHNVCSLSFKYRQELTPNLFVLMIFAWLNFWRTCFSVSPSMYINPFMFSICPGVILSELSSSFRSNSLGVFDKEFRDCFRCVFSIAIRFSLVPYTKPINIKKAEGHSPIRKRGSPSPIHTNRRYPPHITGSIYLFLCV